MLKKEVHVFKGMNRDNNPMSIDPTLAFEIRNMRITIDKTNNSLLSLVNEKGPEDTGLSIAGTYLGHAVLNNYLIIFSTSSFNNIKYDHIQIYEVNLSIEYKGDLLDYVDVGFNVNNPIETIALYENNALQKVYFTDGLNQPRVINIIATKNYKIKTSLKQINKGELAIGFINSDNSTLLNFSTTISLNHKIAITKLHNGGVFPTGVIQYCFSYYNLGMQETSLFEVTPMYYLSQIDHGDDTTELQSCAFRISLTNLDSSYQYVRCYSIIKTSKTSVVSCRIVGDYNIVNNEVNITDTGDIGSSIDATKLLFVGSKTFTAYTMTSKDNTLFLGNLSYKNTKYKINYNDFHFDQCLLDYYGNKQYDISWYGSQPVTKQSNIITNYNPNVRNEYYLYNNDSVNIANDRNSRGVKRFKTNEYYKFGIVLQFSDGSFSDAISLNIKQIGDGGITPIFLKSKNNKPLDQLSIDDYKNNNVDSCFLSPSYRVLLNDNFIDWCNGKDVVGYEKLNNEKVLRIYPICAYPTDQYRSCITQGFLSPTVFNISKRHSNSVYAQSSWIYRYYNNYSGDGVVPNAYHLGSLYFNNKKHCEILNTGTLTDYNKKYNLKKLGTLSFDDSNIDNHKTWYYAPFDYKFRLKKYTDTISTRIGSDKNIVKIPSRLPYFTEECVDYYSDMFFQDCNTLTFNSPETELGLLNNVDFENVNLRIVGFSNFATSKATIKDNTTFNTDNLLIKNFIYDSCDFNGTNRDLDNTNVTYGSGYGKQLDKSKENKYSSVPLFKFTSHDNRAFAHYLFNGDYVAAIATDEKGKDIYHETYNVGSGANEEGKILNTFYEVYGEDNNGDPMYHKYGSLAFEDLTITQSIKGQVHYGFTDYNDVLQTTLPIIDKPKLFNYNTEQALSIFTTYDTSNKMYYGNIKQQGLYNPTYEETRYYYKDDNDVYKFSTVNRQSILYRGDLDNNDLEYDEAIFLPKTVAVKHPITIKYKSTPHIVLSLGDVTKDNKHLCLSQKNNTVDYKITDASNISLDEKYANNISIDNVDYGLFKNSSYLNSKDTDENNPYIAGLFIGELFKNPGDIGIKQTYKFRNGIAVEGDYILRDEHNNYISATNEDVYGYPYYVGKNNGYQLDRIIDDECTYMGGKSNEPYIKWCICGDPITLANDKSDINEFNGVDWVTTKKYELIYQEGDCYIGRFDSMKTYPFEELGDGIVEIYSSELESRVNLDERVDYFNRKNYLQGLRITQVRPYGYSTESSNVAFNTFNDDAYNQENNYFVFNTFDENTITANRFPNQITWSLEKTIGETIDTWSNIQLTSLLDLDGSKGDIECLTKYNDNIFSFQHKGISQILFNSRVQIPTSDNNPIEITNGYKVDGKRYVSETIGSQNKHSIVVGDAGIYFIDNLRSSAYIFGGEGLVPLSSTNGMQTYFNFINNLNKWKPLQYTTKCFYDTKRNEVYYTGNKESLVYNELTKTFTSFLDYDNIMLFENINDKTITLYKSQLYKMFEGKYNNFFLNNYKPFYIKFYSNLSNTPQHKIFNNIEWQTNYFTDTIQPKLTWTDVSIENPYQSTTQHMILSGNSRLDTMEKRFDIFRTYFKRTVDSRNRLERIAHPYAMIGLYHNLSNKDKSFKLEHFNTTVSIQM